MAEYGQVSQYLPTPVTRNQLERGLWAIVLITTLGDLATTHVGLQLGLVEANPVGREILSHYGIYGAAALKTLVLLIAAAMAYTVPDEYAIGVPAGISLVWTYAVINNLYLITKVT